MEKASIAATAALFAWFTDRSQADEIMVAISFEFAVCVCACVLSILSHSLHTQFGLFVLFDVAAGILQCEERCAVGLMELADYLASGRKCSSSESTSEST